MNRRGLLTCGLVLASLLVLFSVSCQTASPAPRPTAPLFPAAVDISGFAFVPAEITVAAGTTVNWTNQDSVSHTVTSKTGVFDSGTLANNATFSHTFFESGVFDYYCAFHPSMKGKVIVE